MVKHVCNKEEEIDDIHSTLKTILNNQIKAEKRDINVENKVSALDIALNGDKNNPGYLVQVRENTRFRIQGKTTIGVLVFLVTSVGGLALWLANKAYNLIGGK